MVEAPPKEPHELNAADGVQVELASRAFQTSGGPSQALAGCRCARAHGEIVAVVGPSGCGKTTLLELICGLQAPDAGTVRAGRGADAPARPAAPVAERDRQRGARAAGPRRRPRRGSQGGRAVARALRAVAVRATRPAELSGGMRQRVSFLRTLLAGKPVLALDEPFAALDAITRQEMQGWLARARGRAPDRGPGHPRRRGGRDARRARGGDVAAAGPRRERGSTSRSPDPAGGRTRPSSSCASARWPRWGATRETHRCGMPAVILLLVLIGIWELYVDLRPDVLADPARAPPGRQSLYDDRSMLWSSFLVTAQEVLLGILAAVAIGAALSVAIHFSPTLRRATYPLIVGSQAVPVVVSPPSSRSGSASAYCPSSSWSRSSRSSRSS